MPTELSPQAQKALRLFEDGCLSHHREFLTKLRERQRAYHAIIDRASDAAEFGGKLHPPFVRHIVESTLASVVDGKLSYKVKPRARFYDPGEYEAVRAGAKAHEILHSAQLAADRFHETQTPFALQDAIAGLTVAKTFWRREARMRPRLKVVPDERAQALGMFIPRLVEEEALDVCYDGPTTEVVNVEDFFWHESAVELQKSPIIGHRVWMSFSELKRLEQKGQYRNVDELKEAVGQETEYVQRRITDGTSRSKDMIEVLELYWDEPDGRHTVTIGNRAVELAAPRKNPFWHGDYPFVTCTTRPELFAIPGESLVERVAHLQDAHWDLENQTRLNVRLLNNAIFIVGDEVTDPDSLEFAPGARWAVEGNPNEMLMPWTPNPLPADLALTHLSRLEQTMQNLAGGYPFTSTSEASTVGADTATQAALATNLAERATIRLKEQLAYAYERIGQQRTELNQQFLRVPIMVEKIGLDSEAEFVQVAPYLLNASAYLFDVAPMVESLMRSERRAEKNALFQTFLQAAQLYLALSQAGAATPLNADEFAREWLESYEVGDVDRFFSAKKPAPTPSGPGQPGQLPAGPQPQQGQGQLPGPGGVTAPQSIDPSVSPSSQASLSPEVFQQRLRAMRGGVSNT